MRKHTINLMRVVQIAKTIRYLGVYKRTVVENRFCDNCGKFYSAAFCPEVLTCFLVIERYYLYYIVRCQLRLSNLLLLASKNGVKYPHAANNAKWDPK